MGRAASRLSKREQKDRRRARHDGSGPPKAALYEVLDELLLTKDHKVAEAIARVLAGKARPGDLQAIEDRSNKMKPANAEKVARAIIEASRHNAAAAKLLLDLTEGEIS